MMKLIQDPYNGYRWQWKFWQNKPGHVQAWFDYGPSFETREEAEEYARKEGLTNHERP